MTSSPPPSAVAEVFGPRLDLARRYADWLAGAGVERGLIGPREAPRLWDRHLLNCAAVGSVLSADATVCDVGSGAGLPGLVLAIGRPDLRLTLVEPLQRRCDFLVEVVADLELGNVEVVRGRADALHGLRQFDYVTSRAVAPLARLVEWCMPLVAPRGAMVAMKGGSAHDEIEDAGPVFAALGCAPASIIEIGVAPYATSVVRVTWADPSRVGLGAARSVTPQRRRQRPSQGGRR